MGAGLIDGPAPFVFSPFPGLGLFQVFIACLARCPGTVLRAVENRNGRQDVLLSKGALSGDCGIK